MLKIAALIKFLGATSVTSHRSAIIAVMAMLILATFSCSTVNSEEPTAEIASPPTGDNQSSMPSSIDENATEIPATNLTNNAADENQPEWSPDGSKIVFVSTSDDNDDIYVMNADGSSLTRLTDKPSSESRPTWSPDGNSIAFTSDRDGELEIYSIDVDGSNLKNLTNHPASDDEPAWSPDGSRIAFASRRDNINDIYVMNADGTNQVRLTDDPTGDFWPVWSPDGAKIAFMSARAQNLDIYVMNSDGTNVTRITDDPGQNFGPVWSPDGARISYDHTGRNEADIYTVLPNGGNLTRITSDPATDTIPIWSPDGTRIAFVSDRDGVFGIYIVDADGSGLVKLTDDPSPNNQPTWSPDGTTIAFVSLRDGEADIFVADANAGTAVKAAGSAVTTTLSPSTVPDGPLLAFTRKGEDGHTYVYVSDIDGRLQARVSDLPTLSSPAWSSDGATLGFLSGDEDEVQRFVVVNSDGSGSREIAFSDEQNPIPIGRGFKFNSDLSMVAYEAASAEYGSSESAQITVIDLKSGQLLVRLEEVIPVGWVSTNEFLYTPDAGYSDSVARSEVINVRTGAVNQLDVLTSSEGIRLVPIASSATGNSIAWTPSFYEDAEVTAIWISNADGTEPWRAGVLDVSLDDFGFSLYAWAGYYGFPAGTMHPKFSPDGRWFTTYTVGSAEGKFTIFDLTNGTERSVSVAMGEDWETYWFTSSPDGNDVLNLAWDQEGSWRFTIRNVADSESRPFAGVGTYPGGDVPWLITCCGASDEATTLSETGTSLIVLTSIVAALIIAAGSALSIMRRRRNISSR